MAIMLVEGRTVACECVRNAYNKARTFKGLRNRIDLWYYRVAAVSIALQVTTWIPGYRWHFQCPTGWMPSKAQRFATKGNTATWMCVAEHWVCPRDHCFCHLQHETAWDKRTIGNESGTRMKAHSCTLPVSHLTLPVLPRINNQHSSLHCMSCQILS
jgi:hypothetical protein